VINDRKKGAPLAEAAKPSAGPIVR
jgi:hypothetical protein